MEAQINRRTRFQFNRVAFLFLSIVVYFNSESAQAQRDHIWYFGNRAGIDFVSGTPVPLTSNAINTYEGVNTICDANGQLLFYTEGIKVRNRNHAVMPNGDGLKGGKSSTQSALAILDPANANRYYLFTADENVGEGMHYSVVDMTADSGLGDILVKNTLLLDAGCEKLGAITHANGIDTWVIGHQWNSNNFYAWRVSASGISSPVISATGSIVTGNLPYIESVGQLKFSPDGTKLVSVNTSINAQLFDFDAQTGIVSNPLTLMSGYEFGAEFSPSGNALYITEAASNNQKIYQFDLTVPDVVASMTEISAGVSGLNWGMLSLGHDSKIYVASYASAQLSVIDKPDVVGLGCNLIPLTASLGSRTTFYGLPTFLQPGVYITEITASGDCVGNAISFSADVTKVPDSVLWDFGDGSYSTEFQPLHSYSQAADYVVKLSVRKDGYERYFSKIISVLPNAVAHQPADMVACDQGVNGEAVFDLSAQDGLLLGTQSPTDFSVTYYISHDDALIGYNPLPLIYSNQSNPQVIYAKVSSASGCWAITSFFLRVLAKPVIDMPTEYTLCNGGVALLTAPDGYGYSWSTGETTSSIVVSSPGTYELTVSSTSEGISCESTIVITVYESATPVFRSIATSDWTNENNSITVAMVGIGSYEYSLDGTNYQDSNVFLGLESGQYTVYVRDKMGCGTSSQMVYLLMYPKFFTPNADGHNDVWTIKFWQHEPDMIIDLFDRYGNFLRKLNSNDSVWDGTYNGRPLPSTDYWFVIRRKNEELFKGHFSLKR